MQMVLQWVWSGPQDSAFLTSTLVARCCWSKEHTLVGEERQFPGFRFNINCIYSPTECLVVYSLPSRRIHLHEVFLAKRVLLMEAMNVSLSGGAGWEHYIFCCGSGAIHELPPTGCMTLRDFRWVTTSPGLRFLAYENEMDIPYTTFVTVWKWLC